MIDDRPYLFHIRDSLSQISEYARDGRDTFFADRRTQDAIIRNLEIIGEAVKNLSETIRATRPAVPWKRIAGMRDLLIHHYFGVKLDTVWDVVEKELPKLRETVDEMLAGLDELG